MIQYIGGIFRVITKCTKRIIPVFDVRNDKNGYPHFLVYMGGEWRYESAKMFEPLSE